MGRGIGIAVLGVLLVMICGVTLSYAGPDYELAPNYVAVRGAFVSPEDTEYDNEGISSGDMDFGTSWGASIAYGRYLVDWFRIEGELGYIHKPIDAYKGDGKLSGQDNQLNVMLNAYGEWPNDTSVTPFIGGGVGFVRSEYDSTYTRLNRPHTEVSDDDTGFAYQLMAGFDFAMSPAWVLEGMYRFYVTDDFGFSADNNSDTITVKETHAHLFSVGAKYRF